MLIITRIKLRQLKGLVIQGNYRRHFVFIFSARLLHPRNFLCYVVFICSTVHTISLIVQELCESRGGRPGLAVRPNEPSGFRGRKAILNHASALVSACP